MDGQFAVGFNGVVVIIINPTHARSYKASFTFGLIVYSHIHSSSKLFCSTAAVLQMVNNIMTTVCATNFVVFV